MNLFRLSRYRPTPKGSTLVEATITAGGAPAEEVTERSNSSSRTSRGGGGGGRAGNLYALFQKEEGSPADVVNSNFEPEVDWISVIDGTRDPGDLEDRAARFLIEQNRIQINADFRVFTDMIRRWNQRYEHVAGADGTVKNTVQEWFEQTLIETVLGVEALKDAREWTIDDVSKALSVEALSAAVMPRYHVDVAIRRSLGTKLGTLRERVPS